MLFYFNNEKAYYNGIEKIIADLEKSIINFKCDLQALNVGSEFFTGIESELLGYSDFEIKKI